MKFTEKSIIKKQDFDDLRSVKQSIKTLLDDFNDKKSELNRDKISLLVKDTYLKLANVLDYIDYDRYLPLRESIISEICKRMDENGLKKLILFLDEPFSKKVIISRTQYRDQIFVYKDFVKDDFINELIDFDFYSEMNNSFHDWANLEKPKSLYPNGCYDYLVERIYENAINVLRSVDFTICYIKNHNENNEKARKEINIKDVLYDMYSKETPPECIVGSTRELIWHIKDIETLGIHKKICEAFNESPINLFIGETSNELINVCKDKKLLKALKSGEDSVKEYLLNSKYTLVKYYKDDKYIPKIALN